MKLFIDYYIILRYIIVVDTKEMVMSRIKTEIGRVIDGPSLASLLLVAYAAVLITQNVIGVQIV